MSPEKALQLIHEARWSELAKLNIQANFTWGEAFTGTQWANKERLKQYATPELLLELKATFFMLQMVRGFLGGQPVTVTSAYRDPDTNAAVGGVRNSTHTKGKAVDFVVNGLSPNQVQTRLAPWYPGGLGYGRTFTHLDTRMNRARFDY